MITIRKNTFGGKPVLLIFIDGVIMYKVNQCSSTAILYRYNIKLKLYTQLYTKSYTTDDTGDDGIVTDKFCLDMIKRVKMELL